MAISSRTSIGVGLVVSTMVPSTTTYWYGRLLVLDYQRHRTGLFDEPGLARRRAGVDPDVTARDVVVPDRDTRRRPALGGGDGKHGDMLRREEFLTLSLVEGSHTSGNTVARLDYSRYSGIQRTSLMRWVSSASLRLGATPSETAWTATAWAMRTAISGTSGHAGNSG